MGWPAGPAVADRRVFDTGPDQRFRIWRFGVAAELPGHDRETVGDDGQEMVGEGPVGGVAMDGPAGGRLGRERGDEGRDAPRAEPPPMEIVEVDVVVAEQISLDRVAMVG